MLQGLVKSRGVIGHGAIWKGPHAQGIPKLRFSLQTQAGGE